MEDVVAAARAWRAHRHPKRAALVDQLVARAPEIRIAAPTKEEFQKQWIAAAALDPEDPVRTIALAKTFARKIPILDGTIDEERWGAYFARIAALAERPHVPGVARAIVEFLEQAPLTGYDVSEIYAPAIALLVAINDTRVIDRLTALVERPRSRFATLRGYFATAIPRAIAAMSVSPPLPAEEEAELDRMIEVEVPVEVHVTSRSADELDALRAECIARPDDDAARMVYADALLERGDPRGAFIQLQLTSPNDVKAHAALLRKHEREWLGEAARVIKLRVWRRGFLDEAELVHRAAADPGTWARAATSPALASLRTLRRGKASEKLYATFVGSPVLAQLRAIEVATPEFLAAIERRDLEQLDFRLRGHRPTFDRVDPHLDRLGITRVSFQTGAGPTEIRDVVLAWPGRRTSASSRSGTTDSSGCRGGAIRNPGCSRGTRSASHGSVSSIPPIASSPSATPTAVSSSMQRYRARSLSFTS